MHDAHLRVAVDGTAKACAVVNKLAVAHLQRNVAIAHRTGVGFTDMFELMPCSPVAEHQDAAATIEGAGVFCRLLIAEGTAIPDFHTVDHHLGTLVFIGLYFFSIRQIVIAAFAFDGKVFFAVSCLCRQTAHIFFIGKDGHHMEHVLLHVVVHHVARELTLVLELPRLNDAVFVHVVVLAGFQNGGGGSSLDGGHTRGIAITIFCCRNVIIRLS